MARNNRGGCLVKTIIFLIFIGFILWGLTAFMPETVMKGAEELKAKFGKAPEDTTKIDSIQIVEDVLEIDSSIVIPLTEQDGVHYVTVLVCDIPMRFILDTGCSGIQISPIEYYYLVKQNKLSDNSILPDSVITTNAEGEMHKKVALIIPKIQVGNIEVSDIQAVVSPAIHAPALLGQDVLGRLGTLQLDYKNKQLKIIQ